MSQLPAYLLCIAIVFITTSHGQLSPVLCPDGPIPPNPSSSWTPVPSRFEIITEYVGNDGVAEISQAFSMGRDSVFLAAKQGVAQLYWNFQTNEQFEVLTAAVQAQFSDTCIRVVIDPNSNTSVITSNSLMLKPSVLLGYDERNQQNRLWGVREDGTDQIRGIPVKKYKSCFYVKDIKKTVAATYYASDVSKIQSYMPPGSTTPILVQIDVEVEKTADTSEKYTYNVFRYTPNPSRREERQALETPAGVFCPNRISTLNTPENIPERSSANAETFVPNFNSSIVSSHNLYDTEFQFTRFDAWYGDPSGGPRWQHFTEIHDFALGLSYRYNHSTYQCEVNNLTMGFGDVTQNGDNPNLLQMGSPQHLFLMDDMAYQYTGEKPCRDRVWCHVWIGRKVLPNNTLEQREWYWAMRINDEPLTTSFPVKLIIKRYKEIQLVDILEFNVFNYRRRPMTIFEIDHSLANCYRALGPSKNFNLAVLNFRLEKNNHSVFENLNYLRLHIFEKLMFTMGVRPIRISNLVVDNGNESITVTFTLLDTPPFTGPVESPLKERDLDSVINRLTNVIDSDGLYFQAREGSRTILLRARAGSLNVEHRSLEKQYTSSGPTITALWIVLIIVGIVIGAVGSVIVFNKISGS